MPQDRLDQLLDLMEAREAKLAARETRFKWLALGVCVTAAIAMPGLLVAATVTVPNTFTNGEVADADDINDNFTVLADEATRVSNIVVGNGTTSGNRVVGLDAPLASTDAANKSYVDAAVGATGGGGGSVVELLGASSCPAGWDVAMTGSVGLPPDFGESSLPARCLGPDFTVIDSDASASIYMKTAFSWDSQAADFEQHIQASFYVPLSPDQDAVSCVVCVK